MNSTGFISSKILSLIALIVTSTLLLGNSAFKESTLHLCEGFLPENNLTRPIADWTVFGLDEQMFNEVLDRIEKFYSSEIRNLGGKLVINRYWSNSTVNASAMRLRDQYIINMYGGLARFEGLSEEAFALVACHEIGHHLGGAPKVQQFMNTWASNEGQSDYFANSKCLRSIYSREENILWVEQNSVNPFVENKCLSVWQSLEDQATCMRFAMAGENIAHLFKALKKIDTELNFETPDTNKANKIDDKHPHPQCRMDTYFQGSLCDKDRNEAFHEKDYETGACTTRQGYSIGLRPQCWFGI